MTKTLERGRLYLSAALLLCAFLIGGGHDPLRDMLVELLAVPLLVLCFATMRGRPHATTLAVIVVVALVLLTPLLQLAPLPVPFWASLPGHAAAADLGALAGPVSARPLSLDPEATMRGWLSLLPPVAMLWAAMVASAHERTMLIAIAAAAALASALLGAIQLVGGPAFYPFAVTHFGDGVGIFANRNHQATLALIAIPLVAALAASRRDIASGLLATGAIALLCGALIVARSRMGLALLPVALLGAWLASRPSGARGGRLFAAGIVLALMALAIAYMSSDVVQTTVARFWTTGDARTPIWTDTIVAIRQFWPLGSGIGTFVPVYDTIERLTEVGPRYANHAHDEYLEVALETGVWGIALIVAGIAVLAVGAGRLRRAASPARIAAAVGIAIVLLHSIVDYPLRTEAIATTFALLAAALLGRGEASRRKFMSRRSRDFVSQ